jgi:hypothetical protein
MLARSEMQKKRPELLIATGLYPVLASSISISVFSAIAYFLLISSETTLAFYKISIPEASPRISEEFYKVCKILSSISWSIFLFLALSITRASFFV